jgi:hypothetical protein
VRRFLYFFVLLGSSRMGFKRVIHGVTHLSSAIPPQSPQTILPRQMKHFQVTVGGSSTLDVTAGEAQRNNVRFGSSKSETSKPKPRAILSYAADEAHPHAMASISDGCAWEFPRWPLAGKHMQRQDQFGRDNDSSHYGLKSRKNCCEPVMGLVMTFCPPMTVGAVELVCQATGGTRLVADSSA